MFAVPKVVSDVAKAIGLYVGQAATESLAKSKVRADESPAEIKLWAELRNDKLVSRVNEHLTRTDKPTEAQQAAFDEWMK